MSVQARTDIAEKAFALQAWFSRNSSFDYEEPNDDEVDTHIVDWSRISDQGRLWKFPTTGFCNDRLTKEEIDQHLPKAKTLLDAWRKTATPRNLPNSKETTEQCEEPELLEYLAKTEFKPLSKLHGRTILVPNERYLSFKLWEILRVANKDTLIEWYSRNAPPAIKEKLQTLHRYKENPYWTASDVRHYPFVPPKVCAKDYQKHPWKGVFTPTEFDTWEEAFNQLEALGKFKQHFLKNSKTTFWDGHRLSFSDPKNYLSISRKRPPGVLFRTDQDISWSREEQRDEKRNVLATFADDLFAEPEDGPGEGVDIDWGAEAAKWEAENDAERDLEAEDQSDNQVDASEAESKEDTNLDSEDDHLDSEGDHSEDEGITRTRDSGARVKVDASEAEGKEDTNLDSEDDHSEEDGVIARKEDSGARVKVDASKEPEGDATRGESFAIARKEDSGATVKVDASEEPGGDAMATPKGELVPISDIKAEDVVLNRPQRAIFDGNNAGAKFKSAVSQTRVLYDERLEWPIVNTFPDNVMHDPMAKVSLDDFKSHCQPFTVLPDFWKHWSLMLNIEDRGEFYKLDFNSEGNLALNFTPHGAAATVKDQDGTRKFAVWNQYQLHGDVGERLKLRRKMPINDWKALMAKHHPGAPSQDARRRKLWYCCPGAPCPSTYQMPQDWDVLGQVPAPGTQPPQPIQPAPTEQSPPTKKRRIGGLTPQGLQFPPAPTTPPFPPPGESSKSGSSSKGPLHPKPWSKSQADPVQDLNAENATLKTKLALADRKIRALGIFASRCDNALWLVGGKLGEMEDCTSIIAGVDNAATELGTEFPSLEGLLTYHEDPVEMRETSQMAEWVAKKDHVED